MSKFTDEVHKAVQVVEIEFEKISSVANLNTKGLQEAIANLKQQVVALEKQIEADVKDVEDVVTPSPSSSEEEPSQS